MMSGIHSAVVSDSWDVKPFIPVLAQALGRDNRNNGTVSGLTAEEQWAEHSWGTPERLAFFQQVGHLHGHVGVRGGVLALPPMT